MKSTSNGSIWSGNVVTIVSDRFCVASDDGEKVYRLVRHALDSGKDVVLSFDGVESMSSAFLNSAVGQLLNNYSREALQSRFHVEHMSSDDEFLLNRVIENAERYFSNPERFERQRNHALFSA